MSEFIGEQAAHIADRPSDNNPYTYAALLIDMAGEVTEQSLLAVLNKIAFLAQSNPKEAERLFRRVEREAATRTPVGKIFKAIKAASTLEQLNASLIKRADLEVPVADLVKIQKAYSETVASLTLKYGGNLTPHQQKFVIGQARLAAFKRAQELGLERRKLLREQR